MPGDTTNVPWIGKRIGPIEISEHFRLLKQYIQPEIILYGYVNKRQQNSCFRLTGIKNEK